MKTWKRILALTLVLCMAIPGVNVSASEATNSGTEATSDEVFGGVESVDMDALIANAALAQVYTGEDQVFDGTRAVDVTSESAEALQSVNTGSVILRFKAETNSAAGILLLTKDVDLTLTESQLNSGSLDRVAMYMKAGTTNFRFSYPHTWAGYDVSVTDGYWHTLVLSSLSSGKYMRLTVDGTEVWSNTSSSNQGMFAKHTNLSQVNIGGLLDSDGEVQFGFKGEISHVIVTSEEISDAAAIEISRVGNDEPVVSGSAISEMFTSEVADISWVFTGNEDVKGGFEQTRGERNYPALFEKYDRGGSSGSFSVNRQRYVVNAGKEGQSLSDVVESYETRIAAYAPKAAVYLVSSEDWGLGEAGLTQFKTDLVSFIESSLDLRENDGGFAVIQKPFAVNDDADNANIEMYCEAIDEVIDGYESTEAKYERIYVVDHYTDTKDNEDFLTNGIDENGRLTADGHFIIGRQFTVAVAGCTEATFNSTNAVSAKTEAAMPEQYLEVQPTVTAADDSLAVVIPEGYGTAWKYELDMDGTIVSGNAASNSFTISGLASGKTYTLKIQSQDGTTQLTTMKGTITAGNVAVENVLANSEKNKYQQEIAAKVAGDEPLTWLFMGDSITHATTTYGYDGVVQVVEDYVANELGRTDDIVVNAGVNNATTEHTLENIQYRLKNYTPDILAIQLGTNDAIYFDALEDGATGNAMGTGYQSGVVDMGYADKFEKYTAEMQEIIDTAKEINEDVTIILRSPIPSLDSRHVNMRAISYYVNLMKELAETNDCLFIDQYTDLQSEVDTYSWMRTTDNSFFFTDSLHPGTNGHRVMAQWFIKACGLWTDDSEITNLMYEISITEETSSVEPEIGYTKDRIAVSEDALESASGQQFGHIILTAEADGQSYQVTASDSEDYAVLENLPGNKEYTVTVAGYLKSSAKKVTFAATTVALSDDAEAEVDVVLKNTEAQELTVGSVVSEVSVGVLSPAGEYTYTLCDGDGAAHNGYFEIADGQLVVKRKLEKGMTYQIRINASNGSVAAEEAFEIYAAGVREEIPVSAMTPTAGSSHDGEGPENAIDEDTSTIWHVYWYNTDSDNLWYQIELDEVYYIDGFRYQPRTSQTNGIITAYEIYTSLDGEEWTLAADGTWAADNTSKEANFSAVEAQYVKLVAVESVSVNSGYVFASASEIRLTGFTASGGEAEEDIQVVESELPKAGSIDVTDENMTFEQPFEMGTADSKNFRIPALITLDNGDLVAAADARWTWTLDARGLDTIAAVSRDNGETWYTSFPIYFPDSDSTTPDSGVATTVIDPALVQGPDGAIYCIADVNPSGITTYDIWPAEGTGYVEIDGVERLVLTDTYVRPTSKSWDTYGDPSDAEEYEYYVGDFNTDGYAKVFNRADDSATDWLVDEWFNLYKLGEDGCYAALTQTQVDSETEIQQNVFYKDSELHVYSTGYILYSKSYDNGETWVEPTIITSQIKNDGETALLVSPGQGMVTSDGDIVIPFYSNTVLTDSMENSGEPERASIIWSSDNGDTWHRSNNITGSWSSESEVVEINDGVLRIFTRNGTGTIRYADITKGEDGTWTCGESISTGVSVTSTCNVSAIRYSETIDGKIAVIVACPSNGGSRADGSLFTFLVDEDNSMELYYEYEFNKGYYAYSCLTELANGDLGLLWEDSWGGSYDGTIRYDAIEIELATGELKKVSTSVGESYVEEKVSTDAYTITEGYDETIVAVSQESIDMGSVTLLRNHSGSAVSGSVADSFDAASDETLDLENAVFTLKASGDYWQIYNEATGYYLTNNSAASTFFETTARDMIVESINNGEYFRIRKSDGSRPILFYLAGMNFNANSSYSASDQYNLVLLERVESASDTEVIPGFKRATELTADKEYLISYIIDEDVIVLYPTNGVNNQTKAVGETQEITKQVLTITGLKKGTTSVTADNVEYEVTVTGAVIPVEKLTAQTGSAQSGYDGDQTLDNDTSSIWHTTWSAGLGRENHWITFTIDGDYLVDGLNYLPRQDGSSNGVITEYLIEVSQNGTDWTTAATGSWSTSSAWKSVEFDPVLAKYVRLTSLDATSAETANDYASAAEIRLTGTVRDESECTHANTEAIGEAKDATCTEDGTTAGVKCSECGDILTAQETIPATGHTEVAIGEATEPTCTEDGITAGVKCSECGDILTAQETIPATGHTEVVDEAVNATCTGTGLTAGSHCSECGETIVAQAEVAALGHSYGEYVEDADHDCHSRTCSVCNEVVTEAHFWVDGTCEKCGAAAPTADHSVVVFINGNQNDAQSQTGVKEGMILTVTALEVDGKVFSHWSYDMEGNNRISSNKTYTFYVTRDMYLYANYADAPVEKVPNIVVSNTYSLHTTKYYVVIEATRDIPSEYKMVEQGILYGTNAALEADTENDLTFADAEGTALKVNVKKYKGTSTSRKGVLSLKISLGTTDANNDRNVYARGYAVVEKDGVRTVVYTAPETLTYNSLTNN